jgi:integrase
MASYYEREKSPYYWLRLKRADGTWGYESSGIRKDSVGALRKVQQRIVNETSKEERLENDGGKAIMRNWVPQWIPHHYKNQRSADRAMNCWAHLSAYFKKRGILHPEEVTYGVCHDFMKWRTDAKACAEEDRRLGNWNTALTELRILGTIMQEALSQGWILANPCARLRLGRKEVKEKRAISREEQIRIEKDLLTAEQWMRDSWLIGIKQGCRLTEVKVPMNLINTETKVIPFKIKGGKFHPAPLHSDLLPLIQRRRDEGAKYLVDLPKNASRDWVRWLVALGYDDLSFHCLRVTVITRFAMANVTAEKAMQYVGHCSEMCHAIYRKLKPRDVASLGDHL